MTGRTHAIVGANVVWVLKLAGAPADALLVPIAALAALLPDLDASESMAKNLEIGIGDRRNRLAVKPLAPFAIVLSGLFRHRGWLHSWVAVLVVAGLSAWLLGRYGAQYPIIITLGYLSHLFIDAFTKHGIEFFLPVKTRFFLLPKTLRARTGGVLDTGLLFAGAFGIVWFFFSH